MKRTTSPAVRAVHLVGAVLGAYLVVRGIVELAAIDYGNPSAYRYDWGGPSLIGVLTVHCGPALAILAYLSYRLWRTRGRTPPRSPGARRRTKTDSNNHTDPNSR